MHGMGLGWHETDGDARWYKSMENVHFESAAAGVDRRAPLSSESDAVCGFRASQSIRRSQHGSGPFRIEVLMTREWTKQATWLLLRVVTALLFFQAGSLKLFGWYGGMPGGVGATAKFPSEPWIAGVLEVFGGAAIMLGLGTRPVAFILSGEMAVAYWQFHFPHGAWPILNHGELAVLMCFIFLLFAAHGAGAWSVDGWLARRRGH
jgi:putative oxidoreductase